MAKDTEGNRLGALQFELRQGACWLNHVAVVLEENLIPEMVELDALDMLLPHLPGMPA